MESPGLSGVRALRFLMGEQVARGVTTRPSTKHISTGGSSTPSARRVGLTRRSLLLVALEGEAMERATMTPLPLGAVSPQSRTPVASRLSSLEATLPCLMPPLAASAYGCSTNPTLLSRWLCNYGVHDNLFSLLLTELLETVLDASIFSRIGWFPRALVYAGPMDTPSAV
jgi:hypothetical protein